MKNVLPISRRTFCIEYFAQTDGKCSVFCLHYIIAPFKGQIVRMKFGLRNCLCDSFNANNSITMIKQAQGEVGNSSEVFYFFVCINYFSHKHNQ